MHMSPPAVRAARSLPCVCALTARKSTHRYEHDETSLPGAHVTACRLPAACLCATSHACRPCGTKIRPIVAHMMTCHLMLPRLEKSSFDLESHDKSHFDSTLTRLFWFKSSQVVQVDSSQLFGTHLKLYTMCAVQASFFSAALKVFTGEVWCWDPSPGNRSSCHGSLSAKRSLSAVGAPLPYKLVFRTLLATALFMWTHVVHP
ncbi:hypothetical protein B0H19DRAFT_1058546 [Mycena capillaripes]|nr:hypothetical protein B0H19DRAFT_1058546 [Mycena capillaripes]